MAALLQVAVTPDTQYYRTVLQNHLIFAYLPYDLQTHHY
ncbi:hypothetical protein T10_1233 [Trichinella papuae]|uniref:Uncharacterized protein n=1 Tax=Trichinella papuae TaxID=268474 RepID=A0A0V1M013_9BILA|nr:hypothetical protein T10_1233 [Trichinella papuae]